MKLYYGITDEDGSLNFAFHNIESLEQGKDAILGILRLMLSPEHQYMARWIEEMNRMADLQELEDYMEDEFKDNGIFYYCLLNDGYFYPSEENYLVVFDSYSDFLNDVESHIFAANGRYALRSNYSLLNSLTFYCQQTEVYYSKGMIGDNCSYHTADGYTVHEECVSDLYYYDNEDAYYFNESNIPEEEEEEEETYTDGYHSRGSEYYELGDDFETPYKIGFEAEKEDRDVKTSWNIYEFNRMTDHMWRKEKDSSLDEYEGFELISPYMKLDADRIISYINGNPVLRDHVNANYSKKCGGHVHLSHRNLSGSELYDSISGYFPIILAMYRGRIRNSYSAAGSKDDMKRGGRMAINVKSDRIEIRVFSAIRNVEQLRFRLKLLQFICNKPTDDFKTALENIKANYKKLFSAIYDKPQFNSMIERAKVYSVDFEFATSEEINN
jgi:hypothetical protein